MCVALPMELVEVDADAHGVVEFDGVRRRVSLKLLPTAAVGEFVLIHAGFAIERIDQAAARAQLELLDELKRSLAQ